MVNNIVSNTSQKYLSSIVCQKLWNNLVSGNAYELSYNTVDETLKDLYVEAIREVSNQTGTEEDAIRNWFENLITANGARGIVHSGFNTTGGIPNAVVDILDKKYYLIRKVMRSGTQWYELTHDRLISPIIYSNKKWKDDREKKKAVGGR